MPAFWLYWHYSLLHSQYVGYYCKDFGLFIAKRRNLKCAIDVSYSIKRQCSLVIWVKNMKVEVESSIPGKNFKRWQISKQFGNNFKFYELKIDKFRSARNLNSISRLEKAQEISWAYENYHNKLEKMRTISKTWFYWDLVAKFKQNFGSRDSKSIRYFKCEGVW